jgi:hypothetical protein
LTCKIAIFISGAEGIRTPDLRRAQAARYFAGRFSSVQNACKLSCFRVDTFPSISGDLLGLLHGCCTCLGNKRKANRAALRYPADRRGTQHKE